MKLDPNEKIKAKIRSLKAELAKLNTQSVTPLPSSTFRPTSSYLLHQSCTQDLFPKFPSPKPYCSTCRSLLSSGFSSASCKVHQKS